MTHEHPEAREYAAAATELEAAAEKKPLLTKEWLRKFGDIEEPAGCLHCGAVAGCCSTYPNCAGGDEARALQASQVQP